LLQPLTFIFFNPSTVNFSTHFALQKIGNSSYIQFLNFIIMKWVKILCLAVLAGTLASFQPPVRGTEYFSAYTGLLSGPNQVEVVLDRTGPDAGDGCVTFKVDIWFNSESNVQTFTFSMANYEVHKTDIVQGPNPTGFAGVVGEPYDVQYNCY
jgi:hypothetical protein